MMLVVVIMLLIEPVTIIDEADKPRLVRQANSHHLKRCLLLMCLRLLLGLLLWVLLWILL